MLLFWLFGLYAADAAINLRNCVCLCVLWLYATSPARDAWHLIFSLSFLNFNNLKFRYLLSSIRSQVDFLTPGVRKLLINVNITSHGADCGRIFASWCRWVIMVISFLVAVLCTDDYDEYKSGCFPYDMI